jgi:hypothetical protein
MHVSNLILLEPESYQDVRSRPYWEILKEEYTTAEPPQHVFKV